MFGGSDKMGIFFDNDGGVPGESLRMQIKSDLIYVRLW